MRGMSRLQVTGLSIVLFVIAASAAGAPPPVIGQVQTNGSPQLAFTSTTISASGMPANVYVTLTGFMIDTHDLTRVITMPAFYPRTDASGGFSLTITGGVQPRSVWILVTRSGYTVAAAGAGVIRQFDIPAGNFTYGPGNKLKSILIPRSHTGLFSIPQPPVSNNPGAVVYTDAKDGDTSDTDQVMNGTATISVSPKAGDTIFVVDYRTLEFFVKTV